MNPTHVLLLAAGAATGLTLAGHDRAGVRLTAGVVTAIALPLLVLELLTAAI